MKFYTNVLLPVATDGVYTYESASKIAAGVRVSVPFGKREVTGIVIGTVDKPAFECRGVTEILDDVPLFSANWLSLIKKISEYYVTPLGTTLHGVLSTKILSSTEKITAKSATICNKVDIILTDDQKAIAEKIPLDKYSTNLLYGITGSGKTEIYLYLAEKVIASGKKVVYLVPEISLTPQLVERIEQRLGVTPSIYHSKLTEKNRNNAFWNFAKGDQMIIIGARSALFAPTDKLGLIIVDEEHEHTYKQEESPAYNLRDMAVMYASMNNIPAILGSATPQVESMANAISGKYILHNLNSRIGNAVLPNLDIVDLKTTPLLGGLMAKPMYDQLYQTVASGKQAILFLNRKGYATSLFCRQCGELFQCLNCSVPLTYYKSGRCTCHYCGTDYNELVCGSCGRDEIRDVGAGTERVEEFVEQMFPGNTIRIDADKVKTIKQLNSCIDDFASKKAQILIGTQLIAKGLHFPDVTYVGILGIDNTLSLPEFRATEKAYQLLMQVSGRAGRGDNKGTVHIQTNFPDHPVFHYVSQDPPGYYQYEMDQREAHEYPPYSKMARILISCSRDEEAKKQADMLKRAIAKKYPTVITMGPAPAVINKIRNQYRYSILVKSASPKELSEMLWYVRNLFDKEKKGTIGIKIDRDPIYFM